MTFLLTQSKTWQVTQIVSFWHKWNIVIKMTSCDVRCVDCNSYQCTLDGVLPTYLIVLGILGLSDDFNPLVCWWRPTCCQLWWGSKSICDLNIVVVGDKKLSIVVLNSMTINYWLLKLANSRSIFHILPLQILVIYVSRLILLHI